MNDLRQLWNSLPHKTAFAVVFGAWCALFHLIGSSHAGSVNSSSMFHWLYTYYNTPTAGGTESSDALCPLIPLVAAVLVWLKRGELTAAPKSPWGPALGFVILGLLLHYAGFIVQQARLSIVGFIVGGFGVLGIVWGKELLRVMVFPWFILLFAIPVDAYADQLTFHLRLLATRVSVGLSQTLLGLNLVREGTQVFHPPSPTSRGFQFDIAAACSGIRSATTIFFITLVFAYLNLRSTWRRVLIVLAAIPLALLGNILRLMVVFMVGEISQVAAKRIETNFGFVTYAGALIGVFLLGRLLREKPPISSATHEIDLPARAQSLPA